MLNLTIENKFVFQTFATLLPNILLNMMNHFLRNSVLHSQQIYEKSKTSLVPMMTVQVEGGAGGRMLCKAGGIWSIYITIWSIYITIFGQSTYPGILSSVQ